MGKETDAIKSITAEQFASIAQDGHVDIMDVRRKSEYDSEHIIGAKNVPLDYVNDNMSEVDKDKTWYVHCAGGYRSMIFASILRARGFENHINVPVFRQQVRDHLFCTMQLKMKDIMPAV